MGNPRLSPEGGKMYAQSSGFFLVLFFLLLIQKIHTNFIQTNDKGVVLEDPQTGVLHLLKKENIKQKKVLKLIVSIIFK